MPSSNHPGFEPGVDAPTRRALFDLRRRIDLIEASSGGGGGTGATGYVHNQGIAAATWSVVHNLGYFPNVTVEDSGGSTVEGEIAHIDANSLTLTFSAAFSGIAYCS